MDLLLGGVFKTFAVAECNESEILRQSGFSIENYRRLVHVAELTEICLQFPVAYCPRNVVHEQFVYFANRIRCHHDFREISSKWTL